MPALADKTAVGLTLRGSLRANIPLRNRRTRMLVDPTPTNPPPTVRKFSPSPPPTPLYFTPGRFHRRAKMFLPRI